MKNDFEYTQGVLNMEIARLNANQCCEESRKRKEELVKAVRVFLFGQGIVTKEEPVQFIPFDRL